MTQQHTQELSERLSAKLRAFLDTLDPEEKAAMAHFLSTPIGGEEDVKGYGQDVAEFGTPLTAQNAEGILSSVVFDLAGFVNTVMSAEAVADSVTNPNATDASVKREIL